ncbi:MAG TPA: methyltransferase domain-containing protein [Dermatophilaceae bacterium]|nr:methyltransferase domain-containing protein [Dermatophilaceae bacterium]
MNGALPVFDLALSRAERSDGRREPSFLVFSDGSRHPFPCADWCGQAIPGDETLTDRCAGPTLDVGCGPGRLVSAVMRKGVPVLGIDISSESLRQTRQRGGAAIERDVFARLPGEHRWHTILLADGNVGIGGDPVGLLRRCGELAAPTGEVLVEVTGPSTPSRAGAARMETARLRSPWFPWAQVSIVDIEMVAAAAGLRVVAAWSSHRRWFAALARQG